MDANPPMPKSDSNRCNSFVGVDCIECSRDVQRKENALGIRLNARIQIIDDSEQSSLGGVPSFVCRLK